MYSTSDSQTSGFETVQLTTRFSAKGSGLAVAALSTSRIDIESRRRRNLHAAVARSISPQSSTVVATNSVRVVGCGNHIIEQECDRIARVLYHWSNDPIAKWRSCASAHRAMKRTAWRAVCMPYRSGMPRRAVAIQRPRNSCRTDS